MTPGNLASELRDCAEVLEKLIEAAPEPDASMSYLVAGARMVVTRIDDLANWAAASVEKVAP